MRIPARARDCFFLLAILSATFLVQFPYRHCEHYNDDYVYLRDAARFHAGSIRPFEYFVLSQNEHCMPVWRAWYYLQWRLFGLAPLPWHLLIAIVQGVGGCLLFLLLRYYTSPVPAFVAGVIWGGSALGSWDNPMALIAASHFSLALTALLAAAYCIQRSCGREISWIVAMSVFLFLSLFTMGAMLLSAPALFVQWKYLVEKVEAQPKRNGWFLASWFLPVITSALLQWFAISHIINRTVAMNSSWTIREIAARFAGIYAISLQYLFTSHGGSASWPMIGLLAMGAVLATFAVADSRGRRLLLCFALLTAGFAGASVVTRLFVPQEQFLDSGRYRYLPTLWWCGIAAILIDQVLRRLPPAAAFLGGGVAVILAFAAIWNQHQLAVATSAHFNQVVAAPNAGFKQIRQSLAEAAFLGRAHRQAVVLPDIEIDIVTISMRLSDIGFIAVGHADPALKFVPVEQFLPRDLPRALVALQTAPQPIGATLANIYSEVAKRNSFKSNDVMTKVP